MHMHTHAHADRTQTGGNAHATDKEQQGARGQQQKAREQGSIVGVSSLEMGGWAIQYIPTYEHIHTPYLLMRIDGEEKEKKRKYITHSSLVLPAQETLRAAVHGRGLTFEFSWKVARLWVARNLRHGSSD